MQSVADTEELAATYRCEGYAIIRGLFSLAEVEAIGTVIDTVEAEAAAHGRSFRHGNLCYRLSPEGAVRMAQWPSYAFPLLNDVRLDRRFGRLLHPLIGSDIKQIINQIHWKPKDGAGGDFAWHQDSRFRRPAEVYRDLGAAYVQTGLAIDPHTPESGGMRFVPQSHLRGSIDMTINGEVMSNAMSDDALLSVGLDPASVVNVVMDPGDLALWSPYLVHGSGPNRSAHKRRL